MMIEMCTAYRGKQTAMMMYLSILLSNIVAHRYLVYSTMRVHDMTSMSRDMLIPISMILRSKRTKKYSRTMRFCDVLLYAMLSYVIPRYSTLFWFAWWQAVRNIRSCPAEECTWGMRVRWSSSSPSPSSQTTRLASASRPLWLGLWGTIACGRSSRVQC